MLAAVGASSAHAEKVTIRSRMIEAFGGGEDATGRLKFLGGLVLNGPRGFGALSGAMMDGDRLLAVSDVGQWFSARVLLAGGKPLQIEDAELFPRLDITGRPITVKRSGDAEALTAGDGGVLVAIEGSQQILRYEADGIAIDRIAAPTRIEVDHALRQAARRNGFESLATLPDGTVIAIVEGNQRTGETIPAFRIGGAPFAIARHGDWSITGADALPGGDLVIVERRYGGGLDVGMRVRRLGAWAVAEDTGVIDGPVLLEAGFASQIDNMEAIAATLEDGRMVLTMLSDDNLSILQRTLLLRFAINDPIPRRKPERSRTALWPVAPTAAPDDLTVTR